MTFIVKIFCLIEIPAFAKGFFEGVFLLKLLLISVRFPLISNFFEISLLEITEKPEEIDNFVSIDKK